MEAGVTFSRRMLRRRVSLGRSPRSASRAAYLSAFCGSTLKAVLVPHPPRPPRTRWLLSRLCVASPELELGPIEACTLPRSRSHSSPI